MPEESELLEFYGRECPHCIAMEPLIKRLERETGKRITKLEVWHNAANAEVMEKFDPNGSRCGGVPFFFNTRTGKWICGAADYQRLKEWALGSEKKTKI